jgi:hypothetical protein
MPFLKNEAPPGVVAAIVSLETQADECWQGLDLLQVPSNRAIWALQAYAVREVERAHELFGANTKAFDATLLNVSRSIPIAMKWVAQHGQVAVANFERCLTRELMAAVDQMMAVARSYLLFEACFPAYHKNFYQAELITPTLVRFGGGEAARERQVNAHRQGYRAAAVGVVPLAARGANARVDQLVVETIRNAQIRRQSITYDDPLALWREIVPDVRDQLRALTRRTEAIVLGDYTLGEFNDFFAALIAICSAHDRICFVLQRNTGTYPLESAVLERTREAWADILSDLSGLEVRKCRSMIADIAFPVGRSGDLHIQPFVVTDTATDVLALAPPFPMHSRHDENILRVCSQVRARIFAPIANQKEAEMLSDLRAGADGHRILGPINLPNGLPDIDAMIVDEQSSTVVLAEMKWIRKTARPVEIPDRNADVLVGVGQLQAIKQFLDATPDHLQRTNRIPRSLDQYQNVHYLLVARDHWCWVEPNGGISIVEYDALTFVLQREADLSLAVAEILSYDWLPVENRDFRGRFERATANAVTIEAESFFAR